MITAVIFDVGGVLIKYNQQADQEFVRKALGTSSETVAAIWKDLAETMGHSNMSEPAFWQYVATLYNLGLPKPLDNLLSRSFGKATEPQMAMLKYAASLRARGLKTAILSNTIAPHATAARESGVLDGFDPVVLSYAVGMRKPHAAIYHHTLELLGVSPQQALFIDDTSEMLEGGGRIGMHTVLAKDPAQIIRSAEALLLPHA